MIIEKQALRDFVEELPDSIDLEEVHHRLYLREKLEAAEEEARQGQLLSHEEVVAESRKWFGD